MTYSMCDVLLKVTNKKIIITLNFMMHFSFFQLCFGFPCLLCFQLRQADVISEIDLINLLYAQPEMADKVSELVNI